MLTFNHVFDDFVTLNDKKIYANLAFDNVLRAYEILEDVNKEAAGKIFTALACFGVRGSYSLSERASLLDAVFNLINDYSLSVDRYNYSVGDSNTRVIDYIKDTGLIYSAFLQAYKIDLFEAKGRLHWVLFITLLNNLPEETRLSKVIGYRTAKIPPANKYNRLEVARAKELKNIYGLDAPTDRVQDKINKALSGVFGMV